MLPFIIIGASLLVGGGLTAAGIAESSDASDRARKAQRRLQNALDRYNAKAEATRSLLQELAQLRQEVMEEVVRPAVETLRALKQKVRLQEALASTDLPAEVDLAIERQVRFEADLADLAGTAAAGVLGGAAAGAALANGAWLLASTFGTASTGTAIAALSGAAAESATLAWLGGGALAVGGGGMAAGAALLDSLVFAPIAPVIGLGMLAYGHKQQEKASAFVRECDVKAQRLRARVQGLRRVDRRVTEVGEVLHALAERLQEAHEHVRPLARRSRLDGEAIDAIRIFLALLKGTTELLRAPILSDAEDLTLHPDSEQPARYLPAAAGEVQG